MDNSQLESLFDTSKASLERIQSAELEARKVVLWIKRDDKIDPNVSGNKWRKLKYNVLQCERNKNIGILTFGGAFSNHLVATAAACKKAGLKSIGVVRGDELNTQSNGTLKMCAELGMQLHFVSRQEYQLRHERFYHEELLAEFSNHFIVPEGGANYWGMIGCQEIVPEIKESFDRIFVAQGTTATSCGVLLGLSEGQKISVVPALKGFQSRDEMSTLIRRTGVDVETIELLMSQLEVLDQYHFGGYSKTDTALLEFIRAFYRRFQVRLDPVYTGKALFAFWEEMKSGKYDGETVVFLHTGGLQGVHGIEEKTGFQLFNG